jgi:lysophospholipase L1-like esterase
MNPILLSFADGTTFFVGLILVFIAEVLLLFIQQRFVRSALTVCAFLGMMLVVASATPLPLWMYVVWLVLALIGVVLLNGFSEFRKVKHCMCFALLMVTVGLISMELPYRRAPELVVSSGSTIYVLGDSISVGMRVEDRAWPEVLQEMSGCRVVNCARAGATVEGAFKQALEISEPSSPVIIEIGGNDLLGGTKAFSYYKSLNRLVGSLVEEHQVLLVELPLFPFQNAYGRAQRRIVAEHGIALLPKKYFTRVLALPGSTSDGLHLTQQGHDAMAAMMNALLFEN